MASSLFPNLFRPLEIGPLSLRNRVVMGAIYTGLSDATKLSAFYAERARGGAGMIITAGVSPDIPGRFSMDSPKLSTSKESKLHSTVCKAIHNEGAAAMVQIVHAGRYANTYLGVASCVLHAPHVTYPPIWMTDEMIEKTIDHFVTSALLAQEAGYDGVEINGADGYLLHQFVSSRFNLREDKFGGSFENRVRIPIDLVSRMRKAVGPNFAVMYRVPVLDLVSKSLSLPELSTLANELVAAGVTLFSTGVGVHESRIPINNGLVPRSAFAWATRNLRTMVPAEVPVVMCGNRVNTGEDAERLLGNGTAEAIALTRPFLADADFVQKLQADGNGSRINTCIGCNQKCDGLYTNTSPNACLVNPRAFHETELASWAQAPAKVRRKVAVVGSGPAGLSCATVAASRGHNVTLFERQDKIGGQLNLASKLPFRREFQETLRYFTNELLAQKVHVRLNTDVNAQLLIDEDFDVVALCTGISPIVPEGLMVESTTEETSDANSSSSSSVRVCSYADVLSGKTNPGEKIVIIGGGHVGLGVANFLLSREGDDLRSNEAPFLQEWGVVNPQHQPHRGGVEGVAKRPRTCGVHSIHLVDAKPSPFLPFRGQNERWFLLERLRTTQGFRWIPETQVLRVEFSGAVHLRAKNGENSVLQADTVILCCGHQSSPIVSTLQHSLEKAEIVCFTIGGAESIKNLDTGVAIRQGAVLGLDI